MLCALSPQYQEVVAAYQVGNRNVSSATLQTVVDRCTEYDESFTLVGKKNVPAKTGPSRTPSASQADLGGSPEAASVWQHNKGLPTLSGIGETPSALQQSAVLFVMILHARRTMMR